MSTAGSVRYLSMHRAQSTEITESTEYRVQGTEHRAQRKDRRPQRAQKAQTGHTAQITEHSAQKAQCRVQGTEHSEAGECTLKAHLLGIVRKLPEIGILFAPDQERGPVVCTPHMLHWVCGVELVRSLRQCIEYCRHQFCHGYDSSVEYLEKFGDDPKDGVYIFVRVAHK